MRGLAVATCCHHRCSWRQYVDKAFFSRRGFSREEFELVCWMTGICLTKPATRHCTRRDCFQVRGVIWSMLLPAVRLCTGWALCGHNAAPQADGAVPPSGSKSQPDASKPAASSNSSDSCARPACAGLDGSQRASLPVSYQQSAVEESHGEPPQRVGSSISRAEKQVVGMMCKQLLDCGRLLWIMGQGLKVCKCLVLL